MKADAQKKPNTQKSPKPKARRKTSKNLETARARQDYLDIEIARNNALKATGMTDEQLETMLRPVVRAAIDGLLPEQDSLVVIYNLVGDFAPKTAHERMICGHVLSTYFFMNVNMHLGMRASFAPIRTSLFQTATKLGHLNKSSLELLHRLQKECPEKQFIPAPTEKCACNECRFMKMNTLEKLHDCMANRTPEVTLDDAIIERAHQPIERMLEISAR